MAGRIRPARFSIQRRGNPASTRRFLTKLADGDFGWVEPGADFRTFETERAAEAIRLCLGHHADDAAVVRHAIH